MAKLKKTTSHELDETIDRTTFQLVTDGGKTRVIVRAPIHPRGRLDNAPDGGMPIDGIGTAAERAAVLSWLLKARDAVAKGAGYK